MRGICTEFVALGVTLLVGWVGGSCCFGEALPSFVACHSLLKCHTIAAATNSIRLKTNQVIGRKRIK
jgi:hypothetical protein